MKKLIALFCFSALVIVTSSLSLFNWVQEHLHESARFEEIKAGVISHDISTIRLVLKDKDDLPLGYHWEEAGREFSYNGMFYDIVSLTKTSRGWELIAVSDEEEAIMVSNQNKAVQMMNDFSTSKKASKLKIHFSLFEIEVSIKDEFKFTTTSLSFSFLIASLSCPIKELISPPPQVV